MIMTLREPPSLKTYAGVMGEGITASENTGFDYFKLFSGNYHKT